MIDVKAPRPLAARRPGALRGIARIPGDKSISHRALILGALAVGETRITGLLEADDVLATAAALRRVGAEIAKDKDGIWHVWGVGTGGMGTPEGVLDFGNSGTGARLMMGALATTPVTAVFTGDESLGRRPMRRVLEPLSAFGTEWSARGGEFLPVMLRGARHPIAIEHEIAVPSAQVKSALLLAALNAAGRTRLAQKALTRDHTERMLKAFGANISVEPDGSGETITIAGEADLKPCAIHVPRDPSSAAFAAVAASIVPDSQITIPGVLLNQRRVGLFQVLREMGARVSAAGVGEAGGEPVGNIVASFAPLRGIDVPPERAPSLIDEYPILAVAASFAEGRTVLRGLQELRVKESDRLAAMAAGLRAIGVDVEEMPDGLVIEGRGPDGVPGGATVQTHMDHRIAMSFLVASLAARKPVTVDDVSMIATSFPEFEELMRSLGADFA